MRRYLRCRAYPLRWSWTLNRWTLVLFTDGLFEGYADANAGERLGVDRIERWCSELGAARWDDDQLDELLAFVEGANGGPLSDDIALLALSSC